MRKNFKTIIIVMLLVLFDQVIKLFITRNLMKIKIFILGDILMFKPYHNTKYSWVNSFSNLGIGLLPHILFLIIAMLIALILFDFVKKRYIDNNFVRYLFTFLFAGIFCSFIDKVFWAGSLDYIRLKGLFTFDLKDIYLSIFEIMLIGGLIFNYKGLRRMNEKEIYNEFKKYIKNKI